MKTIFIIAIALFVLLGVVACQQKADIKEEIGAEMMNQPDLSQDNTMMKENTMIGGDEGQLLLAGTTSTYSEFSETDYKQAQQDGNVILLFFYASWCPECMAEQQAVYDAFTDLNDSRVVGFRVNYKDSDTDLAEVELAREFGISYQHTKVILKDGKRIQKSGERWDKERYLVELTDASQ